MAAVLPSGKRTGASPSPRCYAHDNKKQPIKRTDDVVKYGHPSFKQVCRNGDYCTREPGSEQGAGITPVEQAVPDSLFFFVRTG